MLVKIDIRAVNGQLRHLAERKQAVLLEEIPEVLQKDFENFMMNKTVTKRGDKYYYHYPDFINWLRK